MGKKELLEASYEEKLKQTKRLIMEWSGQFDKNVYVAFSGGKDSTVLLHIARSLYPNIKAVFCDTGLEYPEIREFVKKTENVVWLKPKLTFKQVLDKYGYPVVSKEQSQYIYQYRTAKSEKTRNTRWNGNKYGQGKISEKWKYLVDAPFKISDKCCDIMKKEPSKKFEKETGLKPMIGTMASESSHRKTLFLKGECNAFKAKRPISKPLVFWNDKDIWRYIKENNVPYSEIYNKGFERTGCMFCMYGCHNKGDKRFELMKQHHPRQYDYCINTLGIDKVFKTLECRNENNERLKASIK